MRLFDLIGAAAVAAWLILVGLYVSHVYFEEDAQDLAGGVIIEEGESWMLLTREEHEVGYIHETRTRLDSDLGWLLEYDLLINVEMLGADQFLRTNIRASVDGEAFLKEFAASIQAAATTFKLEGHVDGTTVAMTMDLAGAARERTIELNERPRLANSAVHELVAQVRFTEWTADGKLRHPVYLGLRDDKRPAAPATLQRKVACLRSFYRHLRRTGVLQKDPRYAKFASSARYPETRMSPMSALNAGSSGSTCSLSGPKLLKIEWP